MTLLDRTRGIARAGIGLALGGALAVVGGTTARAAGAPSPGSGPGYAAVCADGIAGHAHCDALVRTDIAPVSARSLAATPGLTVAGYSPASLQNAYNMASAAAAKGSGETVAIVDAYNDPNAAADLAAYRSQFGLPACTVAGGCLRIVSQTGSTTALPPNSPPPPDDWSLEESLDLDMVSAICPNCSIDLVETNSSAFTDLGTGVNEAVALGARFVSNSYGNYEFSSETSYDTSYFNHPGTVITASSGDSGYGVEWPAASPDVTAVGGTSLSAAANTRGWTESVWSNSPTRGAGSGCSAYEFKPSWQTDTGCPRRTVTDVSADADPNTGAAVYDSFNSEGGWLVVGGTSEAAPIIAATYALGGYPTAGTNPASYPYAHTSSLYDVTTGSTASCTPAYLCTGEVGYDGPTGLGTPNGTAAFVQNANGVTGGVRAFQGTDGNLWVESTAGGNDLGLPMKAGTSPSAAMLSTGVSEIAYQGGNGDLWVTATSGSPTPIDSHLGMMSGTNPAIAAAAGGGFNVAFQANTGYLWDYTSSTGRGTSLNQPMVTTSSPAITTPVNAVGGYEIAYQGSNIDLWVTTISGTPIDSHLGMMRGTSPSIAAAASGGFNAAFQANTGYLWDYTSSTGRGTSLNQPMVTTSSPAITAPVDAVGGYEIAYQGSNIDLWVTTISGTPIDSHLGMMSGTNPAIAATPGGGFAAAFQANIGLLFDYSSTDGRGTTRSLQMMSGTSPGMAQ